MFRRTLRSLLLHGYSLLFTAVARLVRAVAPLLPRLRPQLEARGTAAALAPSIAAERARFHHAVVFFCSSAGEFEQARPLIARLQALKRVYVHVIFFSQSGMTFVQARGETVPCSLSPLVDTIGEWGWLFSALRPTITCVVRHELWPGFLSAAQRFSKLYLIDASCSEGERHAAYKRWLRSRLFGLFDGLYTVTEADLSFFRDRYGVAADRLRAVGDTKYDRVVERAAQRVDQVVQLRALFQPLLPTPASQRLVLGSAYRDEVEMVLSAYQQRAPNAPRWQLVIAPHQTDTELYDWIQGRCEAAGLRVVRYRTIASQPSPPQQPADVILVDAIGVLSEVYATAIAAFVGGALHHQVHNVLEPACHGLALAHGPFYKNSQEAIHLVDLGLTQVLVDAAGFGRWWQQLDERGAALAGQMQQAVAKLTGASDRIMAAWQPHLGS